MPPAPPPPPLSPQRLITPGTLPDSHPDFLYTDPTVFIGKTRGVLRMTLDRIARVMIALMVLGGIATTDPALAANKSDSDQVLSLPRFKAETGDVDTTLRRRIRILVPYSKTLFFVDRGKQFGTVAELGRTLEDWLNGGHSKGAKRITVDFVPVARDRLLPALIAGQGDVAAGNLTITTDRSSQVDFTQPWMTNVNEIVVTGPAAPRLDSIEDLAGQEIYVRQSSSYASHLAVLNEKLTAKGMMPIAIQPSDQSLEDEDLMEMVNAGMLPLAIVDDHKAKLWAQVFTNLKVRPDLAISSGGKIGWAVRKNSPKLLETLNAFFKTHREGTAFGNTIKKRYFSSAKIVRDAYSQDAIQHFDDAIDLFRRHGDEYGFDYLMIMAQGYQESQLDQSRRSPRGAVGIMQLMPATAANPVVGIDDIDIDADRNVEAGAKYLRYLIDNYLDDPAIDTKNRVLMGFAAYNAGPGNLARFREAAARSGLNPNIWFDNVENGAARVVGRETVQYVSNIYKYYIAYDMLMEGAAASAQARQQLNP
ncbi:MAG TPA: lytic transglycosylase F [Magnetospirillaceae bacterium]|jgi:membrane-bound lytic murein transglycosylase MltF